ncbi:unnamed protein product [Amoebophrya sp. A120]|nr:unnamed protein product [Amoebophrya sp. A120]|eukprot:GSA120T00002049001.1
MFAICLILYMIASLLSRYPFECYETWCAFHLDEANLVLGMPRLPRLSSRTEVLARSLWSVLPVFGFVIVASVPSQSRHRVRHLSQAGVLTHSDEEEMDEQARESLEEARRSDSNQLPEDTRPTSATRTARDTHLSEPSATAHMITRGSEDVVLLERAEWTKTLQDFIHSAAACVSFSVLLLFESIQLFWGENVPVSYITAVFDSNATAFGTEAVASRELTPRSLQAYHVGCIDWTTSPRPWDLFVWLRLCTLLTTLLAGLTLAPIMFHRSLAVSGSCRQRESVLFKSKKNRLRVARLSFALEVFASYGVFLLPLLAAYQQSLTLKFDNNSFFTEEVAWPAYRKLTRILPPEKLYLEESVPFDTTNDLDATGPDVLQEMEMFSAWDMVPFPVLWEKIGVTVAKADLALTRRQVAQQHNAQTQKALLYDMEPVVRAKNRTMHEFKETGTEEWSLLDFKKLGKQLLSDETMLQLISDEAAVMEK